MGKKYLAYNAEDNSYTLKYSNNFDLMCEELGVVYEKKTLSYIGSEILEYTFRVIRNDGEIGDVLTRIKVSSVFSRDIMEADKEVIEMVKALLEEQLDYNPDLKKAKDTPYGN